jgi:omega-3 fatty acid desaturase (delta-15 desaturase)
MAPRSTGEKNDQECVEPARISSHLLLNNLRKAIPSEAFEKSILKSLYYMFYDYAMWFGLVAIMKGVKGTLIWDSFALWQQIVLCIFFWIATGTFMWAIFMIGHDCGHGTFSDNEYINDLFGHITHGSLLVPFYPWQV